ncbi:hypothetical protein FRC12_005001 [Ceratobasidium sp. 428]|nr:hypothetical protein FRC12_005001 [Ceratobasidium sp. 428]
MPEEARGRTRAELALAGLKQCPQCLLCFYSRGYNQHVEACEKAELAEAAAQEATHQLTERLMGRSNPASISSIPSRILAPHIPFPIPTPLVTENIASPRLDPEHQGGITGSQDAGGSVEFPGDLNAGVDNPDPSLEDGAIRIVYTPRPNRLYDPDVILPPQPPKPPPTSALSDDPWQPFRARQDFEFASAALDGNFSNSITDRMLRLHHEAKDCKVTIKNHKELRDFEDRAGRLLTEFEPISFKVPYKAPHASRVDRDFQVLRIPTRDWMLDLVQDEIIQPHLHFDSNQVLRWDQGEWTRLISEPWTADGWEKTQNQLPPDGLPIHIHLWADKAAIADFGGKKVYPVVARLANLPREIRNGKGPGGGRVVALLPVVEESPAEAGTTAMGDFKCAVWHAALDTLVASIRSAAHVGHATELEFAEKLGLRGKKWRLFPIISIIAADYEEQIIMACHRGVHALFPCVRCLVPHDEQHNLAYEADARDPIETLKLIKQARSLNQTQAEAILKPQSLRPVESVFLSLGPNTNPFQALSYDTLHNDDLGRWRHHLWKLLKSLVLEESKATIDTFEARINAVPPWPELNHFEHPLIVDFADGSKYYDLLKVVLHGMIGLPAKLAPLVELVRLQAEIRLVASLGVHTEERIALGRNLVDRFHHTSEVCHKTYKKHFDFPKMHQLVHLFDDICEKGVTPNFSTKPGESAHGPLRKYYFASSKKTGSVDAEITRKSRLQTAYELIQAQVDLHNASQKLQPESNDEEDSSDTHVRLGSKDRTWVSLKVQEARNNKKTGQSGLAADVIECLTELGYQSLSDTAIKVRECRTIHVQYESTVDWCLYRDILHCAPMFYHKERRDCVLVNSDEGVALARLLQLLECELPLTSQTISLAYVAFFDPCNKPPSVMERATGFRRFRQRPPNRWVVIPARAIIRGALLVPTLEGSRPDDYLVNDIFEPDLYFRYRMYTKDNVFYIR